jgi:hypothetical protein
MRRTADTTALTPIQPSGTQANRCPRWAAGQPGNRPTIPGRYRARRTACSGFR